MRRTRSLLGVAGTLVPAALFMTILAALPARAADAPARVATDAYAVDAPAKPWARAAGLEPAGQLSWSIGKPGQAQALLRVEYEGVLAPDRAAASAQLLRRARAAIRETLDGRNDVTRGEFQPDSMIFAGGLTWRGFAVELSTAAFRGVSWHWFAIHPDFPRRRTAFALVYEETVPLRSTPLDRLADARALARSLVEQGKGLDGDLADAWLDARAGAFAARIDSAQKLCWTTRPEGSRGASHLGYAVSAAGNGDFFQVTRAPGPDSLADAAPAEYGVTYDRNHDGRPDLVVVNRGVRPFTGHAQQPTVAIIADDDFDGVADASMVEDVDADGDDRVEARLRVESRGVARTFTDAMRQDGKDAGKKVDVSKGVIAVRRVGLAAGRTDFTEVFRAAGPPFAELAAARAACAPR